MMEFDMYVGEAKGVARLPEKAPEPPRDTGLKLEKGEEAPNFDNMISESNILRQAEIEKEKNDGDSCWDFIYRTLLRTNMLANPLSTSREAAAAASERRSSRS